MGGVVIIVEFLVCDDFGLFGCFVVFGDLLVMDIFDVNLNDYQFVLVECRWIGEKYLEVEKKIEYYCKWLKIVYFGGKCDVICEWFDIWVIELVKYVICDIWLLVVIGKLEFGQQMVMNVLLNFLYNGYELIRKLIRCVVDVFDEEIIGGVWFWV